MDSESLLSELCAALGWDGGTRADALRRELAGAGRRVTDRCETCDRPLATAALEAHEPGCECAACVAHCWREYGPCTGVAVDWRARALEAERRLEAVRAECRAWSGWGEWALIKDIETVAGREVGHG